MEVGEEKAIEEGRMCVEFGGAFRIREGIGTRWTRTQTF